MTPNVCSAIYFATVLAQTPVATNWWEPLVASGPIGVVLLWFMLRSEKKTNEQTAAINNMVVMIGAAILSQKHADAAISELTLRCKEQAERLQKYENSAG